MIQGLVVDDEIHCAQGVCSAIDWEKIGVTRMFVAYSKEQAQEVLKKEQIDLMITDIEMPIGNGFELLKWVEEQEISPETIMLTSYATFDYARQAIEFHCLDYLLKPVSAQKLEEIAVRAVEAVYEKRREYQNGVLAQYWTEGEEKRIAEFWMEILSHSDSDQNTIVDIAAKNHFSYDLDFLCMPLILEFSGTVEENWDIQKLKDRFTEWMKTEVQKNLAVFVYKNKLTAVCVYPPDEDTDWYYWELSRKIKEFTDSVFQEVKKKLTVYMGEFQRTDQLSVQYKALEQLQHDNVIERDGIIKIADAGRLIRNNEYKRPDFEEWMQFFRRGDYENLIHIMDQFFDQIAFERSADQEVLRKLLHDFMQIFYVTLAEKEIQANLLFEDADSQSYYSQATISIRKLRGWFGFVIQKAKEQIEISKDTNSVAGHIRQYVKKHLNEELSRSQIAEELCMSADYVSRVFKQETGMQLSDYITEQRMAKARQLLTETELSVGEISEQVGYDSITYFSRVFKIRNKMTPKEYREKNGKV